MVHEVVGKSEGSGGKARVIGVPPQPRELVGRDAALVELRARLTRGGEAAVAALHGLPGVGKSTLAAALAYDEALLAHFRGGVFWAGLGQQANVESSLNRWAAALGVELGAAPDARARAQQLAAVLQEQAHGEPVLLIVDDAWAWEDAQGFREIAFPGCAHLCTTRDARIARRFAGEATWVSELSPDDAETLLAARCPKAWKVDPAGLHELAKVAGGLPLGLLLIAVTLNDHAGQARWLRMEIERLADAQAWLALEAADRPAMLDGAPPTLRAIVEMSLTALGSEEQAAFAMLGAFAPKPADFGREAALAVWEAEEKAGDARLRQLVDRGLLEAVGEDRFALHQVLSAVGEARLRGDPAARERHARYHRALGEKNREDWRRIEGELEQIRRGWAWVSGEGRNEAEILAHAYALRIFFTRRGLWKERLVWFERAFAAARALKQPKDEADTLHNIGSVYWGIGNQKRALEIYEQALLIWREVGDRAGEAITLSNIGLAYSDIGNQKRALEIYEQALLIRREVGDRAGEAITLSNIGLAYSDIGNQKRALEIYEQALLIRREVGNRAGEGVTLNNIGLAYAKTGDKKRALETYEQVLPILREVGDRTGEATTLNNIGSVYSKMGDKKRALETYEQVLPILREVGDRTGEATTLFNIAKEREQRGEIAEAVALLEQVVVLDEAVQHPDLESDRAYLERLRARLDQPSIEHPPPPPPEASPPAAPRPPSASPGAPESNVATVLPGPIIERERTKDTDLLTHDGLLEIREAVIAAGLAGSRPALLAGLPGALTAGMAQVASPGDQVLIDVAALKDIGALADGSVPLVHWLKNAIDLAGPRQQADVFRRALDRLRPAPNRSTSTSAPMAANIRHQTPDPIPVAGLTTPKLPRAVVEAYRGNKLALFLGSGLSLGSGVRGNFPTWSQLLERLLDACEHYESLEEDAIQAKRQGFKVRMSLGQMLSELGTLRTALGRDYQATLNSIFRPDDAAPGAAHRAVAALGVRTILTTNYDQLVELVEETPRRQAYPWTEATQALGDLKAGRKVLLKVHGTAERHETVVMSESEYLRARSDASYQAVLRYLLQDHVFLFVGYGMNDPLDLDLAFKGNADAFATAAQRHYLLLRNPTDADRDRYEGAYHVRVLPYADHADVSEFLGRLAAAKAGAA